MEEERFITVTDENNQEIKIEVLDIFTVKEYPDKEYILYSKGEIEGENERTYVAIIKESEEEFELNAIEDEKEWAIVQKQILENINEELGDNNG